MVKFALLCRCLAALGCVAVLIVAVHDQPVGAQVLRDTIVTSMTDAGSHPAAAPGYTHVTSRSGSGLLILHDS